MLSLSEAPARPILGPDRRDGGKGGTAVARKKTDTGAKAKPKAGPLPNVVSMRGRPEWREWLGGLAEKCRATPSGLIDRALAELAKREGYDEPPPRT